MNYTHLYETVELAYAEYLRVCAIEEVEPKPITQIQEELKSFTQWKHVIKHFAIKTDCRQCNKDAQYFNSFIISEKEVWNK